MTRLPAVLVAGAAMLAVVVPPAFAGSAPSAAAVRRAVETESDGCRLVKEESVRLGRVKLWAVRRLVALSGDAAPEERRMLEGIRRIEVVTYRSPATALCRLPDGFALELADDGWRPVVRERSGDTTNLVFQHADGDGALDGLLVIDLEGDVLEVVRIEGRVDSLLEAVGDADAGDSVLGGLGIDVADRQNE